jgi:DNA processing protein
VLAPGDRKWPWGLDALRDPPKRLWCAGELPAGPWVAIVGSRAATPYGIDLARLGVAVVSGLARGIDAAAHRGALDAGGPTVAVLPSGLDRVTPPSHAELARAIARAGALVTEIESGAPRYASEFLERNRLIAATARATVVVEAAESSGALSTAAVAKRLGRPVLAVPGDVDRPTSRGTNHLLRGGARVCEGARDVLAAIESAGHVTMPRAAPSRARGAQASAGGRATLDLVTATGEASDEARVAAVLGSRPLTLDDIAARTGLEPSAALAALTQLEWSGVAAAQPGARWSRR